MYLYCRYLQFITWLNKEHDDDDDTAQMIIEHTIMTADLLKNSRVCKYSICKKKNNCSLVEKWVTEILLFMLQ